MGLSIENKMVESQSFDWEGIIRSRERKRQMNPTVFPTSQFFYTRLDFVVNN